MLLASNSDGFEEFYVVEKEDQSCKYKIDCRDIAQEQGEKLKGKMSSR